MSLISSISGIRGTIGGIAGQNLTPYDLVRFLCAYSWLLKRRFVDRRVKAAIGRDGRVSGQAIKDFAIANLQLCGVDVLDLDFATTPTVELAVIRSGAQGGIVISASHNPGNWNALKLLNAQGEFLSQEDGLELISLMESPDMAFPEAGKLGQKEPYPDALAGHIRDIVALPLVLPEKIAARSLKIIVDAVNSVGALAIPALLDALGVKDYEIINREIGGHFAHDPEPLEKNLGEIKERVVATGADLGVVVDPDVDRLAFIDETGRMIGEEYTLVVAADYILNSRIGIDGYESVAVSNLSSTRALADLTKSYGGKCFSAAVGEVNVVKKMKETGAIIGGEGNGGVIYPPLHYGRDALVGIALILSHLAQEKVSLSALRQRYVDYYMVKDKLELPTGTDIVPILDSLSVTYPDYTQNREDGLKIDFPSAWVHVRPSNTEPIVRIYAEAKTQTAAQALAEEIKEKIGLII